MGIIVVFLMILVSSGICIFEYINSLNTNKYYGSRDLIDKNDDLISKYIPHYKKYLTMLDNNEFYKARNISANLYRKNKNNNSECNRYLIEKIGVSKPNKLLDICACPGFMSIELLKLNKNAIGYGISLHPDENGYNPVKELLSDKYTLIYYNLLTEHHDPIPKEKFDLVHIGCFINHNKDNSLESTLKLYDNALIMAFEHLDDNGNILWYLPYKWNVNILYDYLSILDNYFDNIIVQSDDKYYIGLSCAFIYAKGYKSHSNNKIFHNKSTEKTIKKYANSIDIILKNLINYSETLK